LAILRLVPIHCGTRAPLLQPLGERLEQIFGLEVRQAAPGFDSEIAFDESRGQYNSRILLAQLLRDTQPEVLRVLGVAGVDLFIPVLTYVFGEAQLGGRAAVVSLHRLDDELYGLPPNPLRLVERLHKEAVHELGHTFDLVHCHRDRCVMLSSTYVEEIDLKSDLFCTPCLTTVRAAIQRHRTSPRS
jgi:archaemetzincin